MSARRVVGFVGFPSLPHNTVLIFHSEREREREREREKERERREREYISGNC